MVLENSYALEAGPYLGPAMAPLPDGSNPIETGPGVGPQPLPLPTQPVQPGVAG
jgi:hypothetical protein